MSVLQARTPVLPPAGASRIQRSRLVVTMVALRLLQRCVTMEVTVSSTQSLIRCAPTSSSTRISASRGRFDRLRAPGCRGLIVALANLIQQGLKVEEDRLRIRGDQAAQRRHGQMRLAGAGRANEEQARLRHRSEIRARSARTSSKHFRQLRPRTGLSGGRMKLSTRSVSIQRRDFGPLFDSLLAACDRRTRTSRRRKYLRVR